MSQLLLRIERELSACADREVRGRLLAQKAAYLARTGAFGEAKLLIADLRREHANERSGLVTLWIMLAEGLLHYFENLSPDALDRVIRTQLLALSLKNAELAALSSAWRALMEFERSMFAEMGRSLQVCAQNLTSDNSAAAVRMSMVICDSLLLCGENTCAQTWFMRSREHAVREGDQASMEAIIYSRAAFKLARIRAEHCLGQDVQDQLALLRLELSSARNLYTMIGMRSLDHMVNTCEARLLQLEGRHAEALPVLEGLAGAATQVEYNFTRSIFEIERAFSLFKLGREQEIVGEPLNLDPKQLAPLDVDERLALAWMALEFHSNNEGSISAPFDANSYYKATAEEYKQSIITIKQALTPFLDGKLDFINQASAP